MDHPFLTSRRATIIECLLIFGLAVVPLFVSFPYRVNIFLSWEGAYRLSQGEMPYRDFGMPLGFGYWLVPALFFKLFGPSLISLVKAQVLLNIAGGLAFRSILRSLRVPTGVRVLSVLVYVLSYSFSNFWPWYNNTVIIYQLVGLAFLLPGLSRGKWSWLQLLAAAFFTFLSFFTKQDGGGMALLVCLALLGYHSLIEKRWRELGLFTAFYVLVACAFILPFVPYGFGYWFNHGQPPHNSRLSLKDILDEFLTLSQWIKFYLLIIVALLAPQLRNIKKLWQDKGQMLFILVTLGILVEAALFQVTSYTPPDNNIFYHAFATAFILTYLSRQLQIGAESLRPFLAGGVLVLLWWSGAYYKYISRILDRVLPAKQKVAMGGENVVSRNNFMLNPDTTNVPESQWVFSSLPEFRRIYMPPSTVEGIARLMERPEVKQNGRSLKVLNLTELTPLKHSIGYIDEKGPGTPLWHHLGVGMFNRQLAYFQEKIAEKKYDIVLYEHAPTLNNFFPFALQKDLQTHYRMVDSFLAPRRPTNAMIEVFVR
ncbi:hypothetical protein ACWKWU_13360 [Chitinophaga lutea]